LEKFGGAYLSARVESLKAKVWSKKYKRTLVENNYKIVDGTCEFYNKGIAVKTLKTTRPGLLVRDDSSIDLSSPRKKKTGRDIKLGQGKNWTGESPGQTMKSEKSVKSSGVSPTKKVRGQTQVESQKTKKFSSSVDPADRKLYSKCFRADLPSNENGIRIDALSTSRIIGDTSKLAMYEIVNKQTAASELFKIYRLKNLKDKHDIVSLENFKNWRSQVDGYWTKKTHIEESRGRVIDEMLQIDEKFKRHLKSSEAEAIQETNKNLVDIADLNFPHPKFQIREKDRIKNLAIVKDRMWPIKKMKGSLVKTGEALFQLDRDYLSSPHKEFARRNATTKIPLEGLDPGSQIENANLPCEPTGDHQDLSPTDTLQPDTRPTKRTRTFFLIS
jgi:hypothetical protein